MGETLEPIIGLEVHVQLATHTKLFCGCLNAFGGEPNTRVCPVCMALPGALPVTNAGAVELAIAVGLVLGCRIENESEFARKNYFYPDSPKNYQITQYDRPLCRDGEIDALGQSIRIERIHLEDDAGKLIHFDDETFVDLNRAGVPLVEIVTAPDIRRPEEASALLRDLRDILRYLGASDGNMEQGSLRCDVNVSLCGADGTPGPPTEVKNLNSFRHVERALEFEIARQRALIAAGGSVERATLLWDDAVGEAAVIRSKEAAADYRYFPEPDLPLLVVDDATIDDIRAALPELPRARAARFVSEYQLSGSDAAVLTSSRALADYFEAVAAAAADAQAAVNRITTDVLRVLSERGIEIHEFPIAPERLAGLVALQSAGKINSSTARAVFDAMLESDVSAEEIVAARDLVQLDDTAEIERIARAIVDAHADEAATYRAGKTKVLQFFIGLVMKETDGRANPTMAREIVTRLLS